MDVTTPAIVCAVLPHSETGAVVRVVTPTHGLLAGYARGGRSRRLRPVLQVGNRVNAVFRARVEEQLAALTVELVRARAHLAANPLSAAALEWLGALIAITLPEGQTFEALYLRFDALLDRMETAAALDWTADLARFELALLAELGFGLELSHCAATGQAHDLAYVSPKSRMAVSSAAGLPYADRLFALPPFLSRETMPDWLQVSEALKLTAHFLARDVLDGRAARVVPARERLAHLVGRQGRD